MARSAWFGGAALQQIGQSKIEIKAVADGPYHEAAGWNTLGKTDHINFAEAFDWVDMTNLDYGSRPANAQITGQAVTGEIGLVEMYAEVFERFWPGARVIKAGETVLQVTAKKVVGYRLTDFLFWIRITQFRQGKPSTAPLDIIYALMAPRLETGEMNSDLSPQVITVPLVGFEASSDYTDYPVLDEYDATPLMFWTIKDEYT